MLRSYLRLVLFTVGLLVGLQIPGFINDYVQRVDAHRLEAQQGIKGFSETAKQFYNGNLQALVEHYRASDDPVFRSDADSIALLVNRNQWLDGEWRALQAPWYLRDWHILAASDPVIRQETLDAYRYQVLFSPDVMAWGLVCALLLAWVIESVFVLLIWVARGGKPRTPQRSWR